MALSMGKNGFLEAMAPDGKEVETDQPNALLKAHGDGKKLLATKKARDMKKPAASKTVKENALKRPAASKGAMKGQMKKKQKAADDSADEDDAAEEEDGEHEEGEEEEQDEEDEEGEARDYSLDWYKKDNRVGIKLKHGARNQLCSFGGAAAKGLTKETLMDIGNKVVQELKDGALKEEKQVARERADALIAEEKKHRHRNHIRPIARTALGQPLARGKVPLDRGHPWIGDTPG